MKNLIILFALMLSSKSIYAQNKIDYPETFETLYSVIFDGDTIAILNVAEVSVVKYKFKDTRARWLYERTLRKTKKVVPYYDIALKVMEELEEKADSSSKREFNKYKRQTKKELVRKFEKELRDLTRTEGKILVNMINRNTGKSFNDLIKEYNNPVKVWAYNIVAKRFGYDLKESYDPKDPENKNLEMALKSLGY
ncbi:MAG: DUF4294 domain-containing protein [Chitinophagales bacterium]